MEEENWASPTCGRVDAFGHHAAVQGQGHSRPGELA